MLVDLSPAGAEVLRIVQAQEAVAGQLERLAQHWRIRSVIHGDVRFDNVLFRPVRAEAEQSPSSSGSSIGRWSPLAILPGTLRAHADFLLLWVWTMPIGDGLTLEQMMTRGHVRLLPFGRR